MLGYSPFFNFFSCTTLHCVPTLVACGCLTDRAHAQSHPHFLTVTHTFKFCIVKVSQRPLRYSWLQVLGAF